MHTLKEQKELIECGASVERVNGVTKVRRLHVVLPRRSPQ